MTTPMNLKKNLAVSVLALSVGLTGCANMNEQQQTMAKGTGIGAAAGAAVGAIAGGGRGAAIGAGVGAAAGALGGYVWNQRMEKQKQAMEQSTQGTGVQVTQTADNQLKLNVPSDISFATGSANIAPNFRTVLDSFAKSLEENPTTIVTVVGHTDNTGTDAINNPLSLKRAENTRDYLVARGIAANRFAVEGKGSTQPVAANDNVTDRAKNRRVEIFVAEPQKQAAQ